MIPTPSQLLLTAIILFVMLRSYQAYKKKNLSERFILVWTGFWIGVLVLIYQKDFVSRLANSLGISRGVDLIIYLSLIVLFFLIYKIFILINIYDEKLTQLVRKNALKEAKKPRKR